MRSPDQDIIHLMLPYPTTKFYAAHSSATPFLYTNSNQGRESCATSKVLQSSAMQSFRRRGWVTTTHLTEEPKNLNKHSFSEYQKFVLRNIFLPNPLPHRTDVIVTQR